MDCRGPALERSVRPYCKGLLKRPKSRLEITESKLEESGFSVEPKRWIVERTLGWFGV